MEIKKIYIMRSKKNFIYVNNKAWCYIEIFATIDKSCQPYESILGEILQQKIDNTVPLMPNVESCNFEL